MDQEQPKENPNGKEFAMPSGAVLYVSIAEWGKVKPLHDALARALIGSGINANEIAAVLKGLQARLGLPGAEDPKANKAEQITVLAVFACAEAATYSFDGTPEAKVQFKLAALGYGVFDNPKCRLQARSDYYEICNAVVEVNCLPFAKALYSMFTAHVGKSADTQKSTTEKGWERPSSSPSASPAPDTAEAIPSA
jgi:hypothetical protein